MEAQMTIDAFSQYLFADQNESVVQKVLRQLTQVSAPEKVRELLAQPASVWSGWAF